MKIDIFNHFSPKPFNDKMVSLIPDAKDMIGKRIRNIPALVDLDVRFKVMDMFDEYVQVLSMPTPLEVFCTPPQAKEVARVQNDSFAELVQKYPDRFLGFIASLPMNDPQGLLDEAGRAVKELGAVGVLVNTNIQGRPLTRPETMPLFDLMADLDLPIWIHPTRGADFPDYKEEPKSHYEIWWTLGWPYETSVTMSHLVLRRAFRSTSRHQNNYPPHGWYDPLF